MRNLSFTTLIKLLSFWPPYLGAGIKIKETAPDSSFIVVQMKLHFWNKNYVGTHFGGSLYSMVDPFFMLILLKKLGPNYIVWDKAATISFKKPAKGTVTARFEIPNEIIEDIRTRAESGEKVEPQFQVSIMNQEGQIVTQVQKTLYIKKKAKV